MALKPNVQTNMEKHEHSPNIATYPVQGLLQPPSKNARHYLDLSLAANTRKSYAADLEHFCKYGGSIPCDVEHLADYLTSYAGVLSCATLTRRVAAISKAHVMLGLSSPTSNQAIRMLMRGIRRVHGKPRHQVAALVKEDLIVVLSAIQDDLRGARDKALLLLGFCAALRRSELCRVRFEDLQFTIEGLVLTLPRSKTDQAGAGRRIGIPYGRGKICPVQTLNEWLERGDISSGYLFRSIEAGRLVDSHLSCRSVANIIKTRAAKAGLKPEAFSGHSLRSGLATSAAAHGISSWKIREQTGHKSDAMLARYIRDGNLFRDNAAGLF